MNGHIEHTSIHGPVSHKDILYSIYFPAAYDREPENKFPVVYLLHGLNEDYTHNIKTVATAMEKALEKKLIPPMVIVAPDGYANSLWIDSFDSKKPCETQLIKELMPYIETQCRVVPDRRYRVIAGFSMGGYGAVRFALNYPDLFSLCISMDGAIHTPNTFRATRPDIFKEIFNQDRDYFNSHCVYALSEKKGPDIFKSIDFFFLVGLLESFNDRFFNYLTDKKFPVQANQYIKTKCDHNVAQMLEKEGDTLFAWMGRHFQTLN